MRGCPVWWSRPSRVVDVTGHQDRLKPNTGTGDNNERPPGVSNRVTESFQSLARSRASIALCMCAACLPTNNNTRGCTSSTHALCPMPASASAPIAGTAVLASYRRPLTGCQLSQVPLFNYVVRHLSEQPFCTASSAVRGTGGLHVRLKLMPITVCLTHSCSQLSLSLRHE